MARIIVAVAARADLRSIIDYLEEHAGQVVALRYALEFDAAFDRLVDIPAIGSPRPAYGVGTRIVIIDPYLIFYEHMTEGDIVRVLRILHSHRDITVEMIRHP